MADQSGVLEDAKDAVTDQEHSLGEKAPGTPFIVIALSYLAILAIACGIFALFVMMNR